MPHWLPYPGPVIGTAIAIAAAFLLHLFSVAYIKHRAQDHRERYRRRKFFTTIIVFAAALVIVILWAKTLKQKGTFLGLLGAGVAIALREPLLSVAGRLAIFSGHMYTAGDRIEIQKMTGDVIDIGFFYTRMLEVGAWIAGDQYSGRILLVPNSTIFGTPIINYTQHLSYIWDEVQLPITYESNMEAATRILTEVGGEYTRQFLQGAQKELENMRRDFLVPQLELEPAVYVKVTSNWLQLTMRYVVDPRKRRVASTFIYTEVFKKVAQQKDIQIASETMDLTVHPPKAA
ncbi:MAG TPA: mechanosensitive ion channel family protein [Terriglobales bacterium]|nr:mechanosensitive ion channel family protein [Terriglobales bacterium]